MKGRVFGFGFLGLEFLIWVFGFRVVGFGFLGLGFRI